MKRIKSLEFIVTKETSQSIINWLKKYGENYYMVFYTSDDKRIIAPSGAKVKENDFYTKFNEKYITPSITIKRKKGYYKFYFDEVKKIVIYREKHF